MGKFEEVLIQAAADRQKIDTAYATSPRARAERLNRENQKKQELMAEKVPKTSRNTGHRRNWKDNV